MQNYTNDVGFDFAIHSDFLIHWTGKDFEPEEGWDNDVYSRTNDQKLTESYINRLRDILKYGFWMTEDPFNYPELEMAAKVPQTCFTELKLSQARKHARKFGRLGIGVKRPYLFRRGGRPVVYYGFGTGNLSVTDPFLEHCKAELPDKRLLNFFKPMNSTNILNYDLYSEAEWRILFTDHKTTKSVCPEAKPEYYNQLTDTQKARLKYLLPVDNWLGIIIYPSLRVKKAVSQNEEIRELIQNIISKSFERDVWPIEVDLDACRNF